MDFIDTTDDSVGYFTDDRDHEIFSRSMTTPIAEVESLEENERLRIINEIFGSPGLAAFGGGDLNPTESNCDCDVDQCQQKNGNHDDVSSCEKENTAGTIGQVTGPLSGKPPLSRRKSNPFYSPSRQIVDLVSKKRRSKAPNLLKSQSSAGILTMSQIEDKQRTSKRPDAGSSRTGRP